MRVQDRVLQALENRKGEDVPGAELARALSVSRNAVWKAIESLRKDGYAIAGGAAGYRLSPESDRLTPESVARRLGDHAARFFMTGYPVVPSTNLLVKEAARLGAPEGTVVFAEEQTAGRGRKGRSFYSPCGTGAYLSLLLRPRIPAGDALLLTTAAAVAVAEAVEASSGRRAGIKWVNDVLLDGKKVCGILTEAALDLESGGLEYAVVGIGVNVAPPPGGFPPEIEDVAGAVFSKAPTDARSRIAAEILERFWGYYEHLCERAYLAGYRERSTVTGREIRILSAGGEERAKALAIDDDCRLLVETENGETRLLSSGEVSVRVSR